LDSRLRPAPEAISRAFPGRLRALFGPQHGFGGEDQDNMIETGHDRDPARNIPIFSLYGESREPLPHMLEGIDILLIDLQDVGTRVYTFASTMLNCMRAAAGSGKRVVVLDRPNPLGGEVMEGNCLDPDLYSFVGPYRFPMRHGLTMGEMARIFSEVYDLNCGLEVVPMAGWCRDMMWPDTGLNWMMPSPNMPVPETAVVYPGQVIWEGTNVSEGRGTCRPFEIFGAPFLRPRDVLRTLEKEAAVGCRLQEYRFRPTFHKWKGEICRGFMIHVTDPRSFRPYSLSLALLKAVMGVHPHEFRWKEPPYEYEYHKAPIDLILGDPTLRHELAAGIPLCRAEALWHEDLAAFREWRKPYLLYGSA